MPRSQCIVIDSTGLFLIAHDVGMLNLKLMIICKVIHNKRFKSMLQVLEIPDKTGNRLEY